MNTKDEDVTGLLYADLLNEKGTAHLDKLWVIRTGKFPDRGTFRDQTHEEVGEEATMKVHFGPLQQGDQGAPSAALPVLGPIPQRLVETGKRIKIVAKYHYPVLRDIRA